MQLSTKPHYLQLHLAVWLFSLCGLFAYWVNAGPVLIVFGRTFFAALAIGLYLLLLRKSQFSATRLPSRTLLLSSFLLVIHWLTFFFSVQQANVSIALITFASYPIWVMLIGWYRGEAIRPLAMSGQAILIIVGVALVSGLGIDAHPVENLSGIFAGVVSAITFAWLTFINQRLVRNLAPLTLTFWQNAVATIWLLPAVALMPFDLAIDDVGKLALLGVLFTAVAHNLLLHAMRSIPAFVVSVTVCLEPAYGVVAAALLFSEPLTLMIGLGIILVLISNVWVLLAQRSRSKG